MENFDLTKKVKELRTRKGLSQEQLADLSLLSLRTIQRIENGENVPRGDTLKRLAVTLQVSPDEIIDWQVQEDKNVLIMLNISQLGFLAFPLLGVVIPLAIWILKKDKVKDVDEVGKSILNFQISWAISIFICYILFFSTLFIHSFIGFGGIGLIVIFYIYAIIVVLFNAIKIRNGKRVQYKPAFHFLK
jgi:uncharacterized Tic20 family protein